MLAGRTYTLQRKSTLAAATWANLGSVGPLPADQPVELQDARPPAQSAFYRIKVLFP